jgi:hypothetical protein
MSKNIECYGINFEGGKIIKYILESNNCIAYANIQIAMDAPYDGRVADEKLRNLGRSELQFDKKYGYSDLYVQCQLYSILECVNEKYPDKKVIIQIARGRSGISMFDEVLKPIMNILGFIDKKGKLISKKCIINYGYRTKDYFKYSSQKNDFVFINIGMFAVLTNSQNIRVGQICNPIKTFDVLNTDMEISGKHVFNNKKNILNSFNNISKIILYGIADDMPFITPQEYSSKKINQLIK